MSCQGFPFKQQLSNSGSILILDKQEERHGTGESGVLSVYSLNHTLNNVDSTRCNKDIMTRSIANTVHLYLFLIHDQLIIFLFKVLYFTMIAQKTMLKYLLFKASLNI